MKIYDYSEIPESFFQKIEFEELQDVSKIITAVRKFGDDAIVEYSNKFNENVTREFEVTEERIEKALKSVDTKTLDAIKYAIENVESFARAQLDCIKELEIKNGESSFGHKIIPIEKAGCYIPGGNYPLPSSAIMTIVPAKVAGVKRVIACSPKIKDTTIAACHLAKADKIYNIGGVQAVAAMAYGTKTVEKVDKIAGPGNKYVTCAKKQVFGECGIDFLAGPSEVLIVADETANADFIAADMLAQCEHDLDAKAYLICFDKNFAQKVEQKAQEFLKTLPTKKIAEKSFEKSFAIVVNTLDEAAELSNKRAPEHLELSIKNAKEHLPKFTNYGSAFLGNYCAEVFGDYCSGTNHTLPTNQVAKYSGGLSVFDFIKIQTYQSISKTDIKEIAQKTSILAAAEGLSAHKLASDLRQL